MFTLESSLAVFLDKRINFYSKRAISFNFPLESLCNTTLRIPTSYLRVSTYICNTLNKNSSNFSSAVFEENVEVLSYPCRRRRQRRRRAKTLTFFNISSITEDIYLLTIKRGARTSMAGNP